MPIENNQRLIYLHFSIFLNLFADPEFLKEQHSPLLGLDTMPEKEKPIPMTAASGKISYYDELLNQILTDWKTLVVHSSIIFGKVE